MQASKDGALVVFHDLELERLTPLRGPLRRRALGELREVGIPTLDEVLDMTRGRIGVMAEPKHAWLYRRHAIARRTAALLGADDVVVSYEPSALLEARRAQSRLRLLQHVGFGVSIRRAATYAWGVGFHDRRVTRRGLAKARRLGLAACVYTVNDPARMRELGEQAVDGVFTDRPDLLREALRRRA